MFRVLVFVNHTPVAEVIACNLSDLADLSDNDVHATEKGAPHLDIPASEVSGKITGHRRRKSVWRPVGEIAEMAVREGQREGAATLLRGIADVRE